jgi:hypothetical protein
MTQHRILGSSNVHAVAYDAATRALDVTYHDGGTYRYADVPAAKHAALLVAKSHGSYLHQQVKGKHRCGKL